MEAQSRLEAEVEPGERCPACPACGRPGRAVAAVTVRSLARREAKPRVGEGPYRLCTNPACDVVYFSHESAQALRRHELRTRVGFKETAPDRLVCYCLRVTEQQILAEVAEKRCCTTLEDVERATRARRGKACKYTNPTGSCCGPEVRAAINKGLLEIGRGDLLIEETEEQLASDRACCGEAGEACCAT